MNQLYYRPLSARSIANKSLTLFALILTIASTLPLAFILAYVIIKGGNNLNFSIFTTLPEPPGDDLSAGGIGNAVLGTFIVTGIAALIAIPIGIGGGVYLAEYSKRGPFCKFIRFGTNVLSCVPSIIAGVFVYGAIVSTRVISGSTFSAIAGGISLSILMIPSVIKTTDEGLKLVSDDLRKGALGVGASKFATIVQITLPSALKPIATGIILGISRAAGETAPLIFTALFSFYWSQGSQSLLEPIASLSVLIYNFALEPYEAQNELALTAALILIAIILGINIMTKIINRLIN